MNFFIFVGVYFFCNLCLSLYVLLDNITFNRKSHYKYKRAFKILFFGLPILGLAVIETIREKLNP